MEACLFQEREWHTKSIEEVSKILQLNINEGLDFAEIKHGQQKLV
jgi:hypothetical protein